MTPEQIQRDTALFGLVGDALEKTPLPNMLNAFFDYNQLNAFCSIFNIREEDVPFFLTNLKTRSIAGILIEPSRMEHVVEYIDVFTDAAGRSRAVDGAVIREGKLHGYNFKASGLAKELEAGIEGATVAVMGSSPAALAAALEISLKTPKKMVLADASPEASMAMAETIKKHGGFDAFDYERCAAGAETDMSLCDAVVNFMAIDEKALISPLKEGAKVYDAAGSFTKASWQKGVAYQGPYYMSMLQIRGISDEVLGCHSRIDPAYMESAEVIEIF